MIKKRKIIWINIDNERIHIAKQQTTDKTLRIRVLQIVLIYDDKFFQITEARAHI